MTDGIPGPWISGMNAARCNGCGGYFQISDGRCPKWCSGETGWMPANSTRASQEIKKLRELCWQATGVLKTIAKRHLGHSSTMAWRMVTQLQAALPMQETEGASIESPTEARKGVQN